MSGRTVQPQHAAPRCGAGREATRGPAGAPRLRTLPRWCGSGMCSAAYTAQCDSWPAHSSCEMKLIRAAAAAGRRRERGAVEGGGWCELVTGQRARQEGAGSRKRKQHVAGAAASWRGARQRLAARRCPRAWRQVGSVPRHRPHRLHHRQQVPAERVIQRVRGEAGGPAHRGGAGGRGRQCVCVIWGASGGEQRAGGQPGGAGRQAGAQPRHLSRRASSGCSAAALPRDSGSAATACRRSSSNETSKEAPPWPPPAAAACSAYSGSGGGAAPASTAAVYEARASDTAGGRACAAGSAPRLCRNAWRTRAEARGEDQSGGSDAWHSTHRKGSLVLPVAVGWQPYQRCRPSALRQSSCMAGATSSTRPASSW